MKKIGLAVATIVLAVAICAAGVTAAPVREKSAEAIPTAVSVSGNKVIEAEEVLGNRFLNMLNHSYVYGEDIGSVEAIVNNSVIALLELRDAENEDYIAEGFVSEYIYNMYGVEDLDLAEVTPEAFHREGYVYILPRGYSEYEHSLIKISDNEDGSKTVTTAVSVCSHDGVKDEGICTTLMVPNQKSAFGYNIIFSDIVFDGQTV